MADLNDAAIVEQFEQLFGGSEPEPETEPTVEESTSEPEVEETEPTEETTEPESTEPTGEPAPEPENKTQSKQNHAFAELRTQNKKQADLIRGLGRAIGLDPNTSVEEVGEKVQELLLQKQSKETNIPIETLREIESLRSLAKENERIKLESKTQSAFTELAEKYTLNSEQMTDFANHLASIGKNPLDGIEVDIESEYIKAHYQDLVQAAVDKALNAEKQRQEKISSHASGKPLGKQGGDDSSNEKINSVLDLDRYFNSLDL